MCSFDGDEDRKELRQVKILVGAALLLDRTHLVALHSETVALEVTHSGVPYFPSVRAYSSRDRASEMKLTSELLQV